MTDSETCPICIRQDPVTVLDSACMVDGEFKRACLLCHLGLSGSRGKNLEEAMGWGKTLNQSLGGPVRRIIDFVKGHTTASAPTLPTLGPGLADVEARVTRAKTFWRVVAAVGTLAGGAGGMWFQTSRATPTADQAVVTGSPTAAAKFEEKQKIGYQLQFAQSCLDSGILDCTAHLVDPIVHADGQNQLANRIKADLVRRQSDPASGATALDKQEQQALLSLAAADLGYGRSCLTGKNFDCATTLSSLVLQSVPDGYPPGQQLRQDAESLLKQVSANQVNINVEKTKHAVPPKVTIK